MAFWPIGTDHLTGADMAAKNPDDLMDALILLSLRVRWLADVEDHDYDAAAEYLSLTQSVGTALATTHALRGTQLTHYKAKDILRASRLPELPVTNRHVAKDIARVKKAEELSPILLVRDVPLVVADGYHRLCAAYAIREDTEIPCRIADLQLRT